MFASVFEEIIIEEVSLGGDWKQHLLCPSKASTVDAVLWVLVTVVAAAVVTFFVNIVNHIRRTACGFRGHFTVAFSYGGRLLCGCHCCYMFQLPHWSRVSRVRLCRCQDLRAALLWLRVEKFVRWGAVVRLICVRVLARCPRPPTPYSDTYLFALPEWDQWECTRRLWKKTFCLFFCLEFDA